MSLLEHTSTAPIADPAADADAQRRNRLDHPVFGHAKRATVSPITMGLYRVTLGDTVIGYLEAAGDRWIALSGALHPGAVETGRHRLFAAALKILTDPS